jgi:CBS domain-containing protein
VRQGELAAIPNAGRAADPDVPTAALDERLGDVRERVREAGYDTCVAVNDSRIVLGLLRSGQLEGEADATIEDAMRPGPSTFRPHVGVSELAELMEDHDLPNVLITTGEGVLVGLLTIEHAEDVVEEIHRRIQELHREHERDHEH